MVPISQTHPNPIAVYHARGFTESWGWLTLACRLDGTYQPWMVYATTPTVVIMDVFLQGEGANFQHGLQ